MKEIDCMKTAIRMEADKIVGELKEKNMLETIEKFNQLYRYTGSSAGEEAAAYLKEKLDAYGIENKMYEYEAFLGIPVETEVAVVSPEPMEIRAIGDVFSGSCNHLEGPLYYDYFCEYKELTDLEQQERLKACKGKIVLTRDKADFINKAYQAGALAILHISMTKGGYIHHSGIGTVWGNPSTADLNRHTFALAAGISYEDGEKLIEMVQKGPVIVQLSIHTDNTIRTSHMPMAVIRGQSEKYILISCHYDSWYEGITDNAVSDAIALELARVLHSHRNELKRTIRICWWSGHSDGRYAGSAWFCDREWADLQKNCMGHVNLDLTGCKLAKQIRARTTCMEGKEFTGTLIEEFTGVQPEQYIPMVRGADQSFLGVDVPISIMLKYEPKDNERVSNCPSGGPWWHTDQDTIDKLDPKIMMRDAKLNGIIAVLLANSVIYPVKLLPFVSEMQRFLMEIQEKISEEFDLDQVMDELEITKKQLAIFEKELQGRSTETDGIIKLVAGELVRLTYTRVDRFSQDPAVAEKPFPGLREAVGLTRENCRAELYLAVGTTFVRQCNRIVYGLQQIQRMIELQLCEWKKGNEKNPSQAG